MMEQIADKLAYVATPITNGLSVTFAADVIQVDLMICEAMSAHLLAFLRYPTRLTMRPERLPAARNIIAVQGIELVGAMGCGCNEIWTESEATND